MKTYYLPSDFKPAVELLAKQVGDAIITLRRQEQPHPIPDPGYDMPCTTFIVEARGDDDMWGWEFTYSDYASAKAVFDREVVTHATRIAKKALRVAA